MNYKVPVQSLIDHIKTATDVDQWAKDMAENMLKGYIELAPTVDKLRNKKCPICNTVLKGRFCHECGQAVKFE